MSLSDEDKQWIEERLRAVLNDHIEIGLKRVQAGTGTDKPQRQYPPDVIRRYRELDETGGFKRAVIGCVPLNPQYDEVTLACGHKQQLNPLLIKLAGGKEQHCSECAKEWLEKQGGTQ
jgi:hypothetical protein